jgi:hypothetical protein
MKYILVKRTPEGEKEIRSRIREMSVPELQMQALQELQEQFDDLTQRMIAAKTIITGLSLGANEVSMDWE